MLEKVIPVVLKAIATVAKEPLQRSALYIQTLKRFGWNPEHPPAEFSAIYAYTLVEYALADDEAKPEALLQLFAEPEIKQAFRDAFDQWRAAPLSEALDQRLDWKDFGNELNFVGHAIRDHKIDMQREVTVFFAVFLDVVRRSQTPKERLQTFLLTDVQQDLTALRVQLAQAFNENSLAEKVAEQIAGKLQGWLPAAATHDVRKAHNLAEQLEAWFKVLGYGRESHEVYEQKYFEWVITIPVRRKRNDRILVRGLTGEAGIADVKALQDSVEQHRTNEGWLVSNMRVSSGARKAVDQEEHYATLSCYTLDELLDEEADFSQYLDWLETEIAHRKINQDYIPLGCFKDEIDPKTQQKIGVSHYGEDEGWIEGYVDKWLADPSKEHLSILGEFGTGKTWFALHYAWLTLQKYQEAKTKGVERPRLPLVIPLRDYAKAVSVKSLFSEFFFEKHEIPLPGYSAFEQLNRMGKLLLIFDGFDEMAARV
ncbi:MAG: hypothetical protein MJA27_11750, partial [Pseudanabaenales cyanobacterium]|nr:hypothetical protein [Pseudanabaenales cyanobacterium]